VEDGGLMGKILFHVEH